MKQRDAGRTPPAAWGELARRNPQVPGFRTRRATALVNSGDYDAGRTELLAISKDAPGDALGVCPALSVRTPGGARRRRGRRGAPHCRDRSQGSPRASWPWARPKSRARISAAPSRCSTRSSPARGRRGHRQRRLRARGRTAGDRSSRRGRARPRDSRARRRAASAPGDADVVLSLGRRMSARSTSTRRRPRFAKSLPGMAERGGRSTTSATCSPITARSWMKPSA